MKRKLTVRKTIREIKKAWYDAELGPLLTGHALLNLGWTKASIREWLGESRIGINPDGDRGVKLYSAARVRQAQERHARRPPVYCGPVLRHPAELLPAADLGGRVWLGGRSCKGWPAAPAFGG